MEGLAIGAFILVSLGIVIFVRSRADEQKNGQIFDSDEELDEESGSESNVSPGNSNIKTIKNKAGEAVQVIIGCLVLLTIIVMMISVTIFNLSECNDFGGITFGSPEQGQSEYCQYLQWVRNLT